MAFAWFPAADYPEVLRRWPQLTQQGPAKGAADHAAYNLALQRTLPSTPTPVPSRLHVAAVRVEPFLAWCQQAERDPATPMPGPGTPRNCSAEPTPRWSPGRPAGTNGAGADRAESTSSAADQPPDDLTGRDPLFRVSADIRRRAVPCAVRRRPAGAAAVLGRPATPRSSGVQRVAAP